MSETAVINPVTIEGLGEARDKIYEASIQILGITSGMAGGHDTPEKGHGGEIVADQPSIKGPCGRIATALKLFAEAKLVMTTGIDGNGSAANDDAAAATRMAVQGAAISTRIDDIRGYLQTHMRGLPDACPGPSGESIRADLLTLGIDSPQRKLADRAPAQ